MITDKRKGPVELSSGFHVAFLRAEQAVTFTPNAHKHSMGSTAEDTRSVLAFSHGGERRLGQEARLSQLKAGFYVVANLVVSFLWMGKGIFEGKSWNRVGFYDCLKFRVPPDPIHYVTRARPVHPEQMQRLVRADIANGFGRDNHWMLTISLIVPQIKAQSFRRREPGAERFSDGALGRDKDFARIAIDDVEGPPMPSESLPQQEGELFLALSSPSVRW